MAYLTGLLIPQKWIEVSWFNGMFQMKKILLKVQGKIKAHVLFPNNLRSVVYPFCLFFRQFLEIIHFLLIFWWEHSPVKGAFSKWIGFLPFKVKLYWDGRISYELYQYPYKSNKVDIFFTCLICHLPWRSQYTKTIYVCIYDISLI